MCFSLGRQARGQHQVPQKQDAKDDGRREENYHLGPQYSGIDTAITQAIKPEPLSIEPLPHIYEKKQDQDPRQY
jgi:hypothetical protein